MWPWRSARVMTKNMDMKRINQVSKRSAAVARMRIEER
jgi:hypothetical protein